MASIFFRNDIFVIINVILFSISCGYLATLGFNFGSDESNGDRATAGKIMGFHLTMGICIGSLFANVCFTWSSNILY